ncbi:hypothetical protein VNO77_15936 [Canavalia gladiata]|uniref:Uncharacterized protein n=1 Tax=Canavalia gladiata TaxID=3824 RepID=A0AAN9QRJ0_CANGL
MDWRKPRRVTGLGAIQSLFQLQVLQARIFKQSESSSIYGKSDPVIEQRHISWSSEVRSINYRKTLHRSDSKMLALGTKLD